MELLGHVNPNPALFRNRRVTFLAEGVHPVAPIWNQGAEETALVRVPKGELAARVFDKALGPAGRLATRRHEGLAFDHGAQYFTVRDARFRREVARWAARGVGARWDARLRTHEEGRRWTRAPRCHSTPATRA